MITLFIIFKIFEGIFSSMCMTVHIIGFKHYIEPLPHQLIFCGTYFGFLLISILGAVSIVITARINLLMEACIALIGFFSFAICALVSMCYAENDVHLKYITVSEFIFLQSYFVIFFSISLE
jgi:hypothetical protein